MHELGIAHGHGGNKEAYEMSGKLTMFLITSRGRVNDRDEELSERVRECKSRTLDYRDKDKVTAKSSGRTIPTLS